MEKWYAVCLVPGCRWRSKPGTWQEADDQRRRHKEKTYEEGVHADGADFQSWHDAVFIEPEMAARWREEDEDRSA